MSFCVEKNKFCSQHILNHFIFGVLMCCSWGEKTKEFIKRERRKNPFRTTAANGCITFTKGIDSGKRGLETRVLLLKVINNGRKTCWIYIWVDMRRAILWFSFSRCFFSLCCRFVLCCFVVEPFKRNEML